MHALAFVRIVGLVVLDVITEPLRERVIVWLDDAPGSAGAWFAKLITCPWCAGMWLAMVAAPLIWLWGDSPVMLVPALVLALSQVAGMLAGVGRPDDDE